MWCSWTRDGLRFAHEMIALWMFTLCCDHIKMNFIPYATFKPGKKHSTLRVVVFRCSDRFYKWQKFLSPSWRIAQKGGWIPFNMRLIALLVWRLRVRVCVLSLEVICCESGASSGPCSDPPGLLFRSVCVQICPIAVGCLLFSGLVLWSCRGEASPLDSQNTDGIFIQKWWAGVMMCWFTEHFRVCGCWCFELVLCKGIVFTETVKKLFRSFNFWDLFKVLCDIWDIL